MIIEGTQRRSGRRRRPRAFGTARPANRLVAHRGGGHPAVMVGRHRPERRAGSPAARSCFPRPLTPPLWTPDLGTGIGRGARGGLAGPVDVGPVVDADHGDDSLVVVDLVDDPVGTPTG